MATRLNVAAVCRTQNRNRIISFRNSPSLYGLVMQAFHWLTVILVLAAYGMSKSDGYSLYSAEADGLRRVHETLGVLVFLVVGFRLLWRLSGEPPVKHAMPWWVAAASTCVRLVIYALLISIPATAVLGTWLEGIPLTLIGFDVMPQIVQTQAVGQQVMTLHIILGEVMLWVTGVHAAAALFHHFVLRDNVLRSMLPGRR